MSGAIEQVKESVLTIKSGERVGAGFIVSPDGHGLTSAHLVGDSSQVTAVLGAGALGNEILKQLALLGVGNIYVVDMDTSEESNLTPGGAVSRERRGPG